MQQRMKFALFGNTYQAHKSAHVAHLLDILRKKEAQICISSEFYDFLHHQTNTNITGLDVLEFRYWASIQAGWGFLPTYRPTKWRRLSRKSTVECILPNPAAC